MNTIEAIKKRRSIRTFNDKSIASNDIQTLLECAMCAPTARNQQGWKFVLIDDKQILEEISKGIEHGKMCKEADKAIVVCYEVNDELSELYWQQDAAAATQNILLSATELGIASVWVAVHPRVQKIQFISELLKLPETIKPFCIVALGYKDGFLKELNRFDEGKLRYNGWS
jgi:nitroreductase